MNLEANIYELLDKHGILHPDGHDLILFDTAEQRIVTWLDHNEFSEWTIMLGFNGVATSVIGLEGFEIKIFIGWMVHRWDYDLKTLNPSNMQFQSVNHGVNHWNEWVTKQHKLKLLTDKI